MEKQFIPLASGAQAGMSAAVRFGDIIAVAGQVATNAANEIVGRGDIAAQLDQCVANLSDILQQAGASLCDVVSLTTYLTAPENARAFLEARARYFPENPPATTTVLAALLHPDVLVEIQAQAVVCGKPRA